MDRPARARALTRDDPTSADENRPRLAIPERLDASLVLVRHGESELIVQCRFQGRLDTALSARGRRQAELVAERLAAPHAPPALPIPLGPPLVIVHSPLSRAAETAAGIGRAIRSAGDPPAVVPLRVDERFPEIGQGEWEGRLASEIAETDGDRLAAWRQRPTETWAPDGERLVDVRTRATDAIEDLLVQLAAAGRPGTVMAPQVGGYHDAPATHPWSIVVAHDGVFKVALLALFDLPLERFWMWSSDLCGISVVEIRAGRPVVRAMNLTEHLAPLLDEQAQEDSEARARSGAL